MPSSSCHYLVDSKICIELFKISKELSRHNLRLQIKLM